MKGYSFRNFYWGCCVAFLFLHSSLSLSGETARVSIGPGGEQGDNISYLSSISANGRWLAFNSDAGNLVQDDTNNSTDIFVHDRVAGATERVSVASSGEQGNFHTRNEPSISADGRWVAFASAADNLIDGDTNNSYDVFVHDRITHETTAVSVNNNGVIGNHHSWEPSLSADGRWVAFYSEASNFDVKDTNRYSDIYLHDRLTHKTKRISVNSNGVLSDGWSESPKVSADGRFIAYASSANNLVEGDTNSLPDIFVYDRISRITTRVSVNSKGEQAEHGTAVQSPSGIGISANGRWVSFESYADNLVDGDTNGSHDVFLRDRLLGTTVRASENPNGSEGNNYSVHSSLSADGRYVAFESSASNLVEDDGNNMNDVFVYDRLSRHVKRISVKSNGRQANNASFAPSISADGRWVGFASFANNLVNDDTNGQFDVFVRDMALITAYQGDVSIAITQQPEALVKDTTGIYTFTVTNNGPDTIYQVKMTHLISNGLVTGFTPSQGNCRRNATISLCNLQQLNSGESLTLQVQTKAIWDKLRQQLTVASAARSDPSPENNSVTIEHPSCQAHNCGA